MKMKNEVFYCFTEPHPIFVKQYTENSVKKPMKWIYNSPFHKLHRKISITKI